jgi:hypothetical protein
MSFILRIVNLCFATALIPAKKDRDRSSFKVKSMRWDGFWFYLIIDSGNPQKMIG